MYIDTYRAQQQGYDHPLQLFMSKKVKKRGKPHGENLSSRKDKAQNLNNISSICLYLHFNDLNELLLVKDFDEEIVNSMIMR